MAGPAAAVGYHCPETLDDAGEGRRQSGGDQHHPIRHFCQILLPLDQTYLTHPLAGTGGNAAFQQEGIGNLSGLSLRLPRFPDESPGV